MLVALTLPASDVERTRRIVRALADALDGDGAIEVVEGLADPPLVLRLRARDPGARGRALEAAVLAGATRRPDGTLVLPDGHLVTVAAPAAQAPVHVAATRVAVAAPAAAAPPAAAPEPPAAAAAPPPAAGPALLRVFATALGVLVAAPAAMLPDRFPIGLREDDAPLLPVLADPDGVVLALTVDGRAFRVAPGELPRASAARIGARPLPLGHDDRLAALAVVDARRPFLLLVTAAGEVKRAETAPLTRLEPGEVAYDVPPGDRLIAALPHAAGDQVVLQARDGKALRLDLDAIRPVKTPSAGGVAGMRLERGDEVAAATCTAGCERLVVLHRRGNGKAVPLAEYPTKGRGTGGVHSSDPETPKRAPSGPVHAIVALPPAGSALVVGDHGSLLVARAGAVPAGTRAAVAQHVVRTDPGEVVVGAVPLDALP